MSRWVESGLCHTSLPLAGPQTTALARDRFQWPAPIQFLRRRTVTKRGVSPLGTPIEVPVLWPECDRADTRQRSAHLDGLQFRVHVSGVQGLPVKRRLAWPKSITADWRKVQFAVPCSSPPHSRSWFRTEFESHNLPACRRPNARASRWTAEWVVPVCTAADLRTVTRQARPQRALTETQVVRGREGGRWNCSAGIVKV